MKNFLLTLAAVAAACALAFAAFYAMNDEPALRRAAQENDAMTWLRMEFHLNDAQFVAIKKLHDDYGAVCGHHCAAIGAAKKSGVPAVEIAALEKVCVDAMTAHFQRVAAQMTTSEGERYLATVLPRVAGYAHTGAPNLRVTP